MLFANHLKSSVMSVVDSLRLEIISFLQLGNSRFELTWLQIQVKQCIMPFALLGS